MSAFAYWAGQFPGFLLGIVGLLLAETLYERVKDWWDRPKVKAELLHSEAKNGLTLGVLIHNTGRTALLGVKNKVAVEGPHLLVEGKFSRLLDHNFVLRSLPWHDAGEGEVEGPQDLYLSPESLSLPLVSARRSGPYFWLNFLDSAKPVESDVFGETADLSFSASSSQAVPTTTLRLFFLIMVSGRTEYGRFIQMRIPVTLEIPKFGGQEECDFTKAIMRILPEKAWKKGQSSGTEDMGLAPFDARGWTPPFRPPEAS